MTTTIYIYDDLFGSNKYNCHQNAIELISLFNCCIHIKYSHQSTEFFLNEKQCQFSLLIDKFKLAIDEIH